jgi:hypothetical protein
LPDRLPADPGQRLAELDALSRGRMPATSTMQQAGSKV